jgi:hypothetical protein
MKRSSLQKEFVNLLLIGLAHLIKLFWSWLARTFCKLGHFEAKEYTVYHYETVYLIKKSK